MHISKVSQEGEQTEPIQIRLVGYISDERLFIARLLIYVVLAFLFANSSRLFGDLATVYMIGELAVTVRYYKNKSDSSEVPITYGLWVVLGYFFIGSQYAFNQVSPIQNSLIAGIISLVIVGFIWYFAMSYSIWFQNRVWLDSDSTTFKSQYNPELAGSITEVAPSHPLPEFLRSYDFLEKKERENKFNLDADLTTDSMLVEYSGYLVPEDTVVFTLYDDKNTCTAETIEPTADDPKMLHTCFLCHEKGASVHHTPWFVYKDSSLSTLTDKSSIATGTISICFICGDCAKNTIGEYLVDSSESYIDNENILVEVI